MYALAEIRTSNVDTSQRVDLGLKQRIYIDGVQLDPPPRQRMTKEEKARLDKKYAWLGKATRARSELRAAVFGLSFIIGSVLGGVSFVARDQIAETAQRAIVHLLKDDDNPSAAESIGKFCGSSDNIDNPLYQRYCK